MKIAIPLFPGVEELDAMGPFEVFGLARQRGLPVEVRLVSHAGLASVRGFHGAEFSGLLPFTASDSFDWVVVPGGAWVDGVSDGVRLALAEGVLPRILREQFQRGTNLASVCTGTFLLHAAGLLDGLVATTHHCAMADLEALGCTVLPDRVVDAGRIITAGGITSGIDLALHLVDHAFGCAAEIAKMLEYPAPSTRLSVPSAGKNSAESRA